MGVVLDSHKYLYKLITINKHQKHFPRINRKEDVMYGITKQNWQRHKVKRTPSAALNQYNVIHSLGYFCWLIHTLIQSFTYLKCLEFYHGKNYKHYMLLIDTHWTTIEKFADLTYLRLLNMYIILGIYFWNLCNLTHYTRRW